MSTVTVVRLVPIAAEATTDEPLYTSNYVLEPPDALHVA